MSRVRALPIVAAAWGAVAASAAIVVRTATVKGPLAIFGPVAYLDFLLPAVAGWAGGWILGRLVVARAHGGAERPARRALLAALAVEVALRSLPLTIVGCDRRG
jgi:hypothetical protein